MILHLPSPDSADRAASVDLIVVGAGIAGLYMLHTAHRLGLSALLLERGDDIGGTWYWNRYPGARCDVESLEYSYSFDDDLQQEWVWTEKFAAQPEILAYLNHVADRYELRRDIMLGANVGAARFDSDTNRWQISTEHSGGFACRFLVLATGVLSTPKIPDFAGLDSFGGELYNTANWPRTPVVFEGKKVAVIGTGSTGIQIIPLAAETAEHLYVLQRTPSFSLPAHNRALGADELAAAKREYVDRRRRARRSALGSDTESIGASAFALSADEREAELNRVYDYGSPMRFASTFTDLITDKRANDAAIEFVARRIRERLDDPQIAEKVIPTTYALATRRLCIDTGYYETFNRPNVTLVDLRAEPLVEITTTGILTADDHYPVDMIVLATGFDAVTGTVARIDITGVSGGSLREKWRSGPAAYLGVMVAGFPNLFVVTGPGSPSVSSNMFLAIEQHVEFIGGLIEHAVSSGADRVEATVAAEEAWVAHSAEVADGTLFAGAESWYTGANIEGKPRVVLQYLGGLDVYGDVLAGVARQSYRGFDFSSHRHPSQQETRTS